MRGHNICFYGKMRKIILKLYQLPLLTWRSGAVKLCDKLQVLGPAILFLDEAKCKHLH